MHNLHVRACRYSLRIEAMQLQLEFKEKCDDLRPAISVLQQAIEEVMTCEPLREVFYITLLTGNIINGVRRKRRRREDGYSGTFVTRNPLSHAGRSCW